MKNKPKNIAYVVGAVLLVIVGLVALSAGRGSMGEGLQGKLVGSPATTKVATAEAKANVINPAECKMVGVKPVVQVPDWFVSQTVAPSNKVLIGAFLVKAQGCRSLDVRALSLELGGVFPWNEVKDFTLSQTYPNYYSILAQSAKSVGNVVTFDSTSTVPLAPKTIQAGVSSYLFVYADLTGVTAQSGTLNVSLDGVAKGPGGLTWGYTPIGGQYTISTVLPSYPVVGPMLQFAKP